MGLLTPSPEQLLTVEEAKRLDNPFRGSQFGPKGQYRLCDMCGGKFESRGLKLCPDCYDIRKKAPDFIDDRRFVSAAGRATFRHKICHWCGGPIASFHESGRKTRATAKFCSSECRHRHARAPVDERAERFARLQKEHDETDIASR